jgi:AcrR family transcriptional regulator
VTQSQTEPGDTAASVRDRILQTAGDLFYREGTRAIGVDLIVERAGVAKTSLYRHFRTKDDLIEAFLHNEDRDFWAQWDAVSAKHAGKPAQELDAQLEWIGERVARPGYRGCPQINIAAEYADEAHPARKVAVAHKAELRRRLAALASEMGMADPHHFALQMSVVIDGALSSGRALHQIGPVSFLQGIARTISAASLSSQAAANR